MSLRIWLPLNGSLENKSPDGKIITNNNVAVNNAGKMGKCYEFNGSNSYLIGEITSISNNTSDWTYACWFKPKNSHQGCLFSCRTNTAETGITIFYYSGAFYMDDGVRWNFTPSTTLSANTWYHLTFVRKKNVGKFLYINGILANSTTTTGNPSKVSTTNFAIGSSQSATTTVSNNYLNGYLNDVRFYDHALSAQEVKKIAQGLVVHYPLNNRGQGMPNLIPTDLTVWNKEGGVTCTWDSTVGMYKVLDSSHTSSRWGIWLNVSLSANTTYTFSVDGKKVDQVASAGFAQGTSFPANHVSFTTTRSRSSKTITVGDSDATYRIYLNINPVSGGTNYGYYALPKLEKTDTPTNFCLSSSDSKYSIFELNDTKEADISGFGYNGTKSGTFAYITDTPKYSVSEIHTGGNYIYLTPPSTEVATISVWVKWDTIPSGQSVILVDYGSGIGLGLMSTGILCSTSNVGNSYTFSKTNLTANTWYHFVVVKTGATTRKLYINGVEQTTTSNTSTWTCNVNQMQLGKRSSTSDGFIGRLSDFRCYCTALSTDDIQELYEHNI